MGICSCSCSPDGLHSEFINSTTNKRKVSKRNMELLPTPLPYARLPDLDENSQDTLKITIEQQWFNAIASHDNKKIKHLFKNHHKRLKFLKIKCEDGDNSLHKAIQAGNQRLAKFLLILKMDVCICAVYTCKYIITPMPLYTSYIYL